MHLQIALLNIFSIQLSISRQALSARTACWSRSEKKQGWSTCQFEKVSLFLAVFSFSKETAVVIIVLKLPTVLSSICYTKEIDCVKKNLISYCAFSLTHHLISFLSFSFFGLRVYLNASLSISFTRASNCKQAFSFLE